MHAQAADIIATLRSIPRLSLGTAPTPLQSAAHLGSRIGLPLLHIKRDDLTGFAGGGTKVRKIEYDLASIVIGGFDTIFTAGGIQSNLVRLIAAAGAVHGLQVKAVLGGPAWTTFDGNLLLDMLFGAELRHLPDNDDNDAMTAAMHQWEKELQREGKRTIAFPIGGSTALGSLGCLGLMEEIALNLGPETPVQIVLPVGSCGTLAGVILGSRLHLPNARIIGISVSRTASAIRLRTTELMNECAAHLGMTDVFTEADVECRDIYHQEYGLVTDGGKEAIDLAARTEGLILDPVYTGKAMHGLAAMARSGELRDDIPTVFLHTGGLPVLFAYERTFRDPSRVSTITG